MGLECIYKKEGNVIFVWLFWNSKSITYIVTPWMITLVVSWVCVYSWEPMGFTDASPLWSCWCHLALKLKCAILAVFIFKHDLGFLDLCWMLCVIMVVVDDQAPGGRLSISNHHTGSTDVWCGSCFAMERLTAAYARTNLMLPTSLSMNLHHVTIRQFNIFRPSSVTFRNLWLCGKPLKPVCPSKTALKNLSLYFCRETLKSSGI